MPVLKGKYQHVKVFRPSGTRYAEGVQKYPTIRSVHPQLLLARIEFTASEALEAAVKNFHNEFSEFPADENMVIEIVFDSFGAKATVYEISKED